MCQLIMMKCELPELKCSFFWSNSTCVVFFCVKIIFVHPFYLLKSLNYRYVLLGRGNATNVMYRFSVGSKT